MTYDDYLADFRSEFHDIRDQEAFADCLDLESYLASQALAAHLLQQESAGIIYPSMRPATGMNLVCFRPALVGPIHQAETCHLVWDGATEPDIIWQENHDGSSGWRHR